MPAVVALALASAAANALFLQSWLILAEPT